MRTLLTPKRRFGSPLFTLSVAFILGACSSDALTNPNKPTPDALASDPAQALRLGATGLVAGERSNISSFISGAGQFGRELYSISPTESRSVTSFYQNFSDPSGQSTGGWSDRYGNLRNVRIFLQTVDQASSLTSAQQAGARGFGLTSEALNLLYIILSRHNLGAVIEILPSATDLAPFVSRDSVYTYIAARLDEGYTQLRQAGTTAFPFTLPTGTNIGYGGFDTPATYATYNRALKARVQVYRASLANRNVALYQSALDALEGSFIQTLAADRSNLKRGPQYFYGNVSGDASNGLSSSNANLYAHPSIRDDGTVSLSDRRYVSKILTGQPSRVPAESNTPTDLRFQAYPALTSGIPVIDNEELILLRAEARYFTGNTTGALEDINAVRTISGGLAARGAFASTDDFITELLQQRRLSLLLQGHRWVDVRRFGRLTSLPLSGVNFQLTNNQVIPQAECLARIRAGTPALACPVYTAN